MALLAVIRQSCFFFRQLPSSLVPSHLNLGLYSILPTQSICLSFIQAVKVFLLKISYENTVQHIAKCSWNPYVFLSFHNLMQLEMYNVVFGNGQFIDFRTK